MSTTSTEAVAVVQTSVQVVADLRPAELREAVTTALTIRAAEISKENNIERLEIAVKTLAERGITDDVELRRADEYLTTVKTAGATVESGTKDAVSYFHTLHKAAIAAVAPYRDRWTALSISLSNLILNYRAEQRRIKQKQQDELDRAAEEQRRRLADEARKAMLNGDVEKATVAATQARQVMTPIVPVATPILDGHGARSYWDAEITDPDALIKGIAEGKVPLCVVKEWDLGFVKKEATKRGGLDWPGVNVWQGERLARKRG